MPDPTRCTPARSTPPGAPDSHLNGSAARTPYESGVFRTARMSGIPEGWVWGDESA